MFKTFLSSVILILLSTVIPASIVFAKETKFQFRHGQDKILAAFTDYDADKVTDVIMISKDLRSLQVLIQKEKDEITDAMFEEFFNCSSDLRIVGVIPGDFDGDTRVDLAVISIPDRVHRSTVNDHDSSISKTLYEVRLLTHYRLNRETSNPIFKQCEDVLQEKPLFTSKVQPLMLDFNGDMICDLLVEDPDSNFRKIYLGQATHRKPSKKNPTRPFIETIPFDGSLARMSDPHSSAFVDVDGDQIVDIVVTTTSNKFEYYFGSAVGRYGNSTDGKIEPSIKPLIELPDYVKVAGQSSFIDMDGDRRIEHLIPVIDLSGKSRVIMFDDNKWTDIMSDLILGNKTFNFASTTFQGIEFPITLRAGDIDNDGYNDVVTIVEDKENVGDKFVAVLKNVKYAESRPRRLELREVFFDHKDPIVATFFDLAENGKLDLFFSVGNTSTTKLIAIENMDVVQTNFLKVVVASGLCPDDGCVKKGWFWEGKSKDMVNYGSNIPGAQVTYNLLDTNGNRKWSSSGQLAQSAHFALQTPYMIFGLGEFANYIDDIKIVLPINSSHPKPRDHTLEYVVPDAHIVIIPRPPDQPKKWTTKLFLTTGDRLWHTVYTLSGICVILVILIAILHKKEKLEDAPETKQFKQNWLDRR